MNRPQAFSSYQQRQIAMILSKMFDGELQYQDDIINEFSNMFGYNTPDFDAEKFREMCERVYI